MPAKLKPTPKDSSYAEPNLLTRTHASQAETDILTMTHDTHAETYVLTTKHASLKLLL
jgi:hypothetical protein